MKIIINPTKRLIHLSRVMGKETHDIAGSILDTIAANALTFNPDLFEGLETFQFMNQFHCEFIPNEFIAGIRYVKLSDEYAEFFASLIDLNEPVPNRAGYVATQFLKKFTEGIR